jgi:hypothetical protein
MTTHTQPATELRIENNPAGEKSEIAVYIDGAHCGYGKTYRDAAQLRDEILAKRAAQPSVCQRCYGTRRTLEPSAEDYRWQDCPACAQGQLVADGFTFMAQMVRAGAKGPVGATEEQAELEAQERAALVAETRQPAPKRRRKIAPCACPQCVATANANDIHWCKADKEYVAYHAGLYVASGSFLHCTDKLNTHRHTLLSRPLPDATAEEVADVLAAA